MRVAEKINDNDANPCFLYKDIQRHLVGQSQTVSKVGVGWREGQGSFHSAREHDGIDNCSLFNVFDHGEDG